MNNKPKIEKLDTFETVFITQNEYKTPNMLTAKGANNFKSKINELVDAFNSLEQGEPKEKCEHKMVFHANFPEKPDGYECSKCGFRPTLKINPPHQEGLDWEEEFDNTKPKHFNSFIKSLLLTQKQLWKKELETELEKIDWPKPEHWQTMRTFIKLLRE